MDEMKKEYKAMDKKQKTITAKKYDDLESQMGKLSDFVRRDHQHDVGGPGEILQCPDGSVVFNWCYMKNIPNSQFF